MTDIGNHALLGRLTGAFLPLNRADPAPFLAEIVRICDGHATAVLDEAASILIDTWRSTPAQPWPSIARVKDAINLAAFRAQSANANPEPDRDPASYAAKCEAAKLILSAPAMFERACSENWIVPLFDAVRVFGRLPTQTEEITLRERGLAAAAKASLPGQFGMVGRSYLARCKSTIEAIRDYAGQEAA